MTFPIDVGDYQYVVIGEHAGRREAIYATDSLKKATSLDTCTANGEVWIPVEIRDRRVELGLDERWRQVPRH